MEEEKALNDVMMARMNLEGMAQQSRTVERQRRPRQNCVVDLDLDLDLAQGTLDSTRPPCIVHRVPNAADDSGWLWAILVIRITFSLPRRAFADAMKKESKHAEL